MNTPAPRIPYLRDDQVGPPELVAAIRARRGGTLIELDRILLHSPPVAEGWNQFLGRVRTQLELPAFSRELAMCAVAVLNGAEFEWHHHAPLLRDAGASDAQLAAVRRLSSDVSSALDDLSWRDGERAQLAFVVESTRNVRVADATFAAARAALGSDRLLFELLAVTAAYNMVSRVLVGAGVAPAA